LFAWSMGYGVVKVLAWPLPNEEEEPSAPDDHLTEKASERTLNCGHTVWGLAFGPRPRKRPGAISDPCDAGPPTEDIQNLVLATGLNNG
ncbi:hypothetical protein DKP78_19805, partial [Enterococcus faecium]